MHVTSATCETSGIFHVKEREREREQAQRRISETVYAPLSCFSGETHAETPGEFALSEPGFYPTGHDKLYRDCSSILTVN